MHSGTVTSRPPNPPARASAPSARRRSWRPGLWLALAMVTVALVLGPRVGRAQSADNKARAEAKVTEARQDFERADYQSALARLEEAAALFPSPKLHFNFGVVYASLGRNVEALEAFQRFVDQVGAMDANRRSEAERRITELRGRVAAVVVVGDTEGADVLVDGRSYGATPLPRPVLVAPGPHQIVVRKAGVAAPYTDHIDAHAGTEIRIQARLAVLIAPAPPPVPAVTIATPAKPPLGRTRILSLVLGGVGVAATGMGIAYGLIAISRRDEAVAACPHQCSDQHGVNLWSQARSAGSISSGAFVIGAAGIASGVVVWLSAKPAADGALGPQLSLGPGGLQVLGSW